MTESRTNGKCKRSSYSPQSAYQLRTTKQITKIKTTIQRNGLTQIQNMKQQLQTKLIRRLATDQTV